MVSEEILQDWRETYGEIFSVEFEGAPYYFRALTIGEIDRIKSYVGPNPSAIDLENIYVTVGLIYPQVDFNKIKAGYITKLAEEIMRISGVLDPMVIVEQLHRTRDGFEFELIEMMKVFILAAMPGVNEEYLNQLNLNQLIKKVIQSEKIFSLQQTAHGIQSDGVIFNIKPLNEEKPKQKRTNASKEELLRRIRADEKENVGAKLDRSNLAKLEEFDDTILEKAAGEIDPNDPIARKLRQAMG